MSGGHGTGTAGGASPTDGLFGSGAGPVPTWEPAAKLVALVVFVLAVVAAPRRTPVATAAFVVLVAIAVAVSRLPLRVLARRLVIELPFLLFALALPFIGTGPRVEVAGVALSADGLWAAWGIVTTALMAGSVAIALAWTTPVADVLVGLERCRVPRVLVAVTTFMVRYLDVVAVDLQRLQVARISRGDDPRWWWQGRAIASTAGTLFVRTFERGERVQRAMSSRGWTGSLPPGSAGAARGRRWPPLAWAGAAVVVAVVAAVAS